MEANQEVLSGLRMDPRGNTADLLAEKIRGMILSGELPAGFVFPNEPQFCEELGVGRSTLREAYKALESTGFISRVKRSGTVVNGFSDISKSSPIQMTLIMSGTEELMEFRSMIEAELARLAAKRATQENIRNMEYDLEQMRVHRKDMAPLTRYDTEFHMELARASGNRLLSSTMENTKDVFQQGMLEAFQIDSNENVHQALEYHSEILDAVKRHDCEAAYQLMREHIGTVSERISTGRTQPGTAGKGNEK